MNDLNELERRIVTGHSTRSEVAKALGWEFIQDPDSAMIPFWQNGDKFASQCPDFLNDMNVSSSVILHLGYMWTMDSWYRWSVGVWRSSSFLFTPERERACGTPASALALAAVMATRIHNEQIAKRIAKTLVIS